MRTLYSTYYGLTEKTPNWEDCTPFEPLRGVQTLERAGVACTGLVRISGDHSGDHSGDMLSDKDLEAWSRAPFEIFKGESFEIISRRYA